MHPNITKIPPEALVGMSQVRSVVPYGKSTIYKLIAENKFPAQVKQIGVRRALWHWGTILAYLSDPAAWAERVSDSEPQ